MPKIEIRKASLSNLETIQDISKQTFIETFSDVNTPENMEEYVLLNFNAKQLSLEIDNPNSLFYLATLDSETVGYLKLNFGDAQTENANENALEIQRIYVLKEFHGKRIGQLLLDEAIKVARQMAVNSIWLGVWEKNYNAIGFYTKNGFITFDKHLFLLGDDPQTDLLMKLEIS
ncbi:GNAT family N-acetyltransferase [Flavobacterium aestivum]|uniref:GNAT family N-acetyltransferase n=1 Tax=Flavobacterium aestivum TaxID=3003257 RepID=UPI0022858DA0|nr:GNAT family N-acetyltransferase [Flavobacterium aestivum]